MYKRKILMFIIQKTKHTDSADLPRTFFDLLGPRKHFIMFTNPNENLNSKSSWKSEHKLSQLRRYKTSKLCRGKTFIIFGRCSGGIREDIRSKNEE